MFRTGRISGVLLPLFSLRRSGDFGIGDFGAAAGLFDWMKAARQRVWMVLPLLPTAPNDPSPYSTRSAFGLNPLFIDLSQLEELAELGGEKVLSDDERRRLDEARAAPRIRYDLVFPLKEKALRLAFERFDATHVAKRSQRAQELEAYRQAEAGWLEDYALFTAVGRERLYQGFWEWPEPLRDRHPAALAEVKERLAHEVRFQCWMQWVAEVQWRRVREQARAADVLLCGDEPFIIGQDSADCWAHPALLRRDARLGVPPDAFSATGQDWGLPYFDFDAMERDGYRWLRFRAEKSAAYYDLRRIDHAVGYFRQWIRDASNPHGRFVPPDEHNQYVLGERHFRLFGEMGAGVVAEDLGVIPDWVRDTLRRLGIPGYRVMRWERDGMQYRDPKLFPEASLATTGTHDTEPLAEWWESASFEERDAQMRAYPELAAPGAPSALFTPEVHRGVLEATLGAASDLCVLPWQDVLGTRDRVNLPGSMSDSNWAFRLASPTSQLLTDPQTRRAAEFIAELTRASGR